MRARASRFRLSWVVWGALGSLLFWANGGHLRITNEAEAASEKVLLNRVLRIATVYAPCDVKTWTARPYTNVTVEIFTVPAGKILIITDLLGTWRHAPPAHHWDLSVHILDSDGRSVTQPVVVAGTSNERTCQVHFRAGIRVDSGMTVKIGGLGLGGVDPHDFVDVTVSGFLVDA